MLVTWFLLGKVLNLGNISSTNLVRHAHHGLIFAFLVKLVVAEVDHTVAERSLALLGVLMG